MLNQLIRPALLLLAALLGTQVSAADKAVPVEQLRSEIANGLSSLGIGPLWSGITGQGYQQYGLTYYGGRYRAGTLFLRNKSGVVRVLYEFNPQVDAIANPTGTLVQRGGVLYGADDSATSGGAANVFRFDPKSGLPPAQLATWLWLNHLGQHLLLARSGVIYGSMSRGGSYGGGALFRINLDDTVDTFHEFGAPADTGVIGQEPRGTLAEGEDGTVYGTTSQGGLYGEGAVFALRGSAVTLVRAFNPALNDPISSEGVAAGKGGYLYGVASGRHGVDTEEYTGLYRLTTAGGPFQVVMGTPVTGDGSAGPPLPASDGRIYFLTSYGGVADQGTVVRSDRRFTALELVHAFNGNELTEDGIQPLGAISESKDGYLYFGTVSSPHSGSTIYRVGPIRPPP